MLSRELLQEWMNEKPVPSLQEMGNRCNLSRERIRQILKKYRLRKKPSRRISSRDDITIENIMELFNGNNSLKETAQLLKCDVGTIKRKVPELRWPRKRTPKLIIYDEIHDLRFLAQTSHLSPKIIADNVGCSVAAVKKARYEKMRLPRGYYSLISRIKRVSFLRETNIYIPSKKQAVDLKRRLSINLQGKFRNKVKIWTI